MMSCLGQSSSSTNTQLDVNTPISSDQTTPSSVNLTKEYAVAIQSASYSEIWSKIHYEVTSYHGNGEEELQVEETIPSQAQTPTASATCIAPSLSSSIILTFISKSPARRYNFFVEPPKELPCV
ncbi:unnamed protein product [Cuscuta campestris]|uniref:Uncharacterized protein n=1 Tax=Cuscuta campestris TaxID=132261 RepID=A0A484LCK9_9ASTE|nr:unnamed protein product [Cuscuta campestris]